MDCKRCGNCCWSMPREYWKEKLSEEQIALIKLEKEKYKDESMHCEAFVFDEGLGCCLVQKILGREFKPYECDIFEGFQFCNKDGLLPPKPTKPDGVI
jgi:hypothetical protein